MAKFGAAKKGRGLETFVKAVTTAGTPEALSADHKFCKSLTIQALEGNTANVAVGDSAVDLATGAGTVITPLNAVDLAGVYLDEVYVDVGVNGEAVGVTYEEQAL